MPLDGGLHELSTRGGRMVEYRTDWTPASLVEPDPLHWYAVYTKPLMERHAASELRYRGFEVYLPFRAPEHRERLSPKLRPAFPRYLFVRLDVTQPRYVAVFSTPGVSDVVRKGGGDLAPLPDGVIEALIRREINGLHYRPGKEPRGKRDCGFVKGDIVRVVAGPLSGQDGIFEEALDRPSAYVNVFAFGGFIRAELSLDALEGQSTADAMTASRLS